MADILSDCYGRKAVLLPALPVFALGDLSGLFARTREELILCRILPGLSAEPLGVLQYYMFGSHFIIRMK